MSDTKDSHTIIVTSIGFGVLCFGIYYTKKYCQKHVSFSKHLDMIKYIPSNAEMVSHKPDLYYSDSDYKHFSENARYENHHRSNTYTY
tara:strand:+ start:1246 stop:1509 length:264 start_codon:yes stop_codon:yes gene_type:complete